MARKIVQICYNTDIVVALCDDGTVWSIGHGCTDWKPIPAIPQDLLSRSLPLFTAPRDGTRFWMGLDEATRIEGVFLRVSVDGQRRWFGTPNDALGEIMVVLGQTVGYRWWPMET